MYDIKSLINPQKVVHKLLVLLVAFFFSAIGYSQIDSLAFHFTEGLAKQGDRDHAAAIRSFEQAVPHLSGQSDSVQAQIYHQLGLSHYLLRQRIQAIEAWSEAINWRRKFLPPNAIDIIKTQINIGNAYITLNDPWQAKEILIEALASLRSQTQMDVHNLARVYESLGMVSRLTQDLETARQYLTQAHVLREKQYADQPAKLINITTRLFDVYKDLQDSAAMQDLAEKALEYASKVKGKSRQSQIDLANAYNNLGLAYAANNQPKQALIQLHKAAKMNARLEERQGFVALAYSNMILQQSKLHQVDSALNCAQKAKEIYASDSSYQMLLAETTIEEGDVYFQQEKYEHARLLYQESITLLVPNQQLLRDPSLFLPVEGSFQTLLQAIHKKGQCLYQEGSLQEAEQTVSLLLALAESRRLQLSDISSKTYLLATNKQFYELAVEIQYAAYQNQPTRKIIDRLLRLFERSKAGILYDALVQNIWSNQDPSLKKYMDQEKRHFRKISEKQIQVDKEPNAQVKQTLNDSILFLRSEISSLRDSIMYLLLGTGTTSNPSSNFEELVALCDRENGDLVQYFVGERNTYVLFGNRQGLQFTQVGPSVDLEENTLKFLSLLKDHTSSWDPFLSVGFDLYQHLLHPFLSGKDNVLIIPDGILALIPFEALPTNTSGSDFRSLHYLIRHCRVRYAASHSVLAMQSDSYTPSSGKMLAMGTDYRNTTGHDLTVLHHAVEEVSKINNITQGKVLLNAEATRQNFEKMFPAARQIHLSLHAFTNDANPSRSYLQFHPTTPDSESGKLYAAEIYQRQLDADLTVLSACATGVGNIANGAGILSLAHAFAYAGSRSTLLSLWQVWSQSSAQLMVSFYENLSRNTPIDAGLQAAKLHWIKNTKATELTHPFYWAPFVQYGQTETNSFPKNKWPFVLVGVLLVTMIFYSIFRKISSASC